MKATKSLASFVCLTAALTIFLTHSAHAAPVICVRKSNQNITIREKRCKSNETALKTLTTLQAKNGLDGKDGINGIDGQPGVDGQPGADGSLRIYGDGSAGSKVVTSDTALADLNLQYTDFTVQAGATLIVESGTVIRCTGTFTNNGTISIGTAGSGGALDLGSATYDPSGVPAIGLPDEGVSLRSAQAGEIRSNAAIITQGGRGGRGLSDVQASGLLNPGMKAGGGGAGSALGGGFGGRGGGTITILCKNGINNAAGAIISAPGSNGGTSAGGGAGGIVILASPTSVNNAGSIIVTGGNGGASGSKSGTGGGGTGGIVNIISPVISPAGGGTVLRNGGTPGAIGAAINSSVREGGAGGGASGGGDSGGDGGVVPAGNPIAPSAASGGGLGALGIIQADPTSMF